MKRTVLAGILLGLGALGGRADAEVQATPRVYPIKLRPVGQASPLVPQRLHEQLRGELSQSTEIELLPELALDAKNKAAAAAPDPLDRLNDAREHAASARKHLEANEIDAALAEQEKAVAGLDADAAYLDRFGELVDAMVMLGVLQIRGSQEDAGDATFQKVVTIAPDYVPDLAGQPDPVADIFNSARGRTLKRKKGGLAVATDPAGCAVSVDGRPLGKAAAKPAPLLPGTHWVLVTQEGRKPRMEKVDVATGPAKQTRIALGAPNAAPAAGSAVMGAYHGEIVKRLGQGLVDKRIKSVAGGFSKSVGADYLVFGHVSRDAGGYLLRAYVYKRDGDKLAEVDAAHFDGELANANVEIARVAERVVRAVGAFPDDRDINTVAVAPGSGLERAAAEAGAAGGIVQVNAAGEADINKVNPRVPVWRRWWFWTGVGVVVVGGAVAAYLALAPGEPGYNAGVTWPTH